MDEKELEAQKSDLVSQRTSFMNRIQKRRAEINVIQRSVDEDIVKCSELNTAISAIDEVLVALIRFRDSKSVILRKHKESMGG